MLAMRSSLKILILLCLCQVEIAHCSAGFGLDLGGIYDLVKQTAPTLLKSISGLKMNAAIPPDVILDVYAYGNGVTNVVNTVIFNGEGGMKPAFDIMSYLKGMSASPTSILNLQTYVQSAAFVGYTAYKMYHLRKMSNDLHSISQELRKIDETTRGLDIIVESIRENLANIETMLSLMKISYIGEVYVIEERLKKASNLAKIGKSKIESIFQNLFRQKSEIESTEREANYRSGTNVVVALGTGAGYLIFGLSAFTALPVTAVASLAAVYFKWNAYEANQHFSELQRFSKHILEREREISKMEENIQNLNMQIQLEKARIQGEIHQRKENARREEIEEAKRKDIAQVRREEIEEAKRKDIAQARREEIEEAKRKDKVDAKREEYLIRITLTTVFAGCVCLAILRFTANRGESRRTTEIVNEAGKKFSPPVGLALKERLMAFDE